MNSKMKTVNMLFVITSVCGLVVSTALAVDLIDKVRQMDERLQELEWNNIGTEHKLDNVLQAISVLNKSHCDVSIVCESGARLDVDSAVDGEVDITPKVVQDVISHLKRAFKEEKVVRKQAIASMKEEIEAAENDMRSTARSELLKVNDVVQADRNITMGMITQLDRLQTGFNNTIDSVSHMNVSFEKALATLKNNVTNDLNERIEAAENDMRSTARSELLKVNDAIQALKDSAADDRAMIARMAETIDILKDVTYLKLKLKGCLDPERKLQREWNGHLYTFMNIRRSFDDAIAECGKCNAHLVDIQSNKEERFVLSLANGIRLRLWIGLNDRNEEGRWTWHHNNETPHYSQIHSRKVDVDDCAAIHYAFHSFWYVSGCTEKLYFVCKI